MLSSRCTSSRSHRPPPRLPNAAGPRMHHNPRLRPAHPPKRAAGAAHGSPLDIQEAQSLAYRSKGGGKSRGPI
eukprot:207985-Pyramimonas_sp.AAC.1